MRLFSEKGYEKTTMRGISKEAKLGLGALYYYFPSKESIVLRFYEELQEELLEEWPSHDPGENAELAERLRAFLHFKFSKLELYRPLMKVLLKEAVDPDSPLSPLSSDSQEALDKSLEIFVSLVEPEQRDSKMPQLLWMGHLAVIAAWIHRPGKTEQLIALFADTAPFMALMMSRSEGPLDELLSEG